MKYIKSSIVYIAILFARLIRTLPLTKKYFYVFPPASTGSLGDEALLCGLYSLLQGQGKAASLRQVIYPAWKPLQCPGIDEKITHISVSDTQSRLNYIKTLLSCRHFMVLGADIMDGRYSHNLVEDIVLFCNIAVRMGLPATILGFSFSDTPNEKAVDALKKLDPRVTCFCRDAKALERFQQNTGHSAELVADLAFHLQPAIQAPAAQECSQWITTQKKAGRLVLGFNVNRLVTENTGLDAARLYAGELESLMDKHENIFCVFLPHDLRAGQSDYDFLLELKGHLPEALQQKIYLPDPPFNAWDMKGLAGLTDLVIAGRMHLTIGALAQGVPAVGVTYQGKFEGLFAYFEAVDLLFDPSGLSQPGTLTQHIENILPDLKQYEKKIKNNIQEVKDISARNVKYM